MNKIKVSIYNHDNYVSKLEIVKLIKYYSGLGLRESKLIYDEVYGTKNPIVFDIDPVSLYSLKCEFENIGLSVKANDRERKLKKILYANQATCIKDMLNDVSKWESSNILTIEDKQNLTYNECREKVIDIIFKKYEEYLKGDQFLEIYKNIKNISNEEQKNTELKIIKFNKEFGEMCSEYLKLKKYSYKEFNRNNLIEEMADSLQVLLSIFSDLEKHDIFLSDVINEINEKMKN